MYQFIVVRMVGSQSHVGFIRLTNTDTGHILSSIGVRYDYAPMSVTDHVDYVTPYIEKMRNMLKYHEEHGAFKDTIADPHSIYAVAQQISEALDC